MTSLYFILKNTVLTFVLVSLLQIQLGSKTLETYLMSFIRNSFAPTFLGQTKNPQSEKEVLSPKQLKDLKSKIKESSFYKDAKSSVKKTIMKEVQSLYLEESTKE